MRPIIIAVATLVITSTAVAQTPQPQETPSVTRPSQLPSQPPGAATYSSEFVAKSACGPQSTVVWIDTDTKIYHFAGSREYGKTAAGAYMCRADADKVGRAAENEKDERPSAR